MTQIATFRYVVDGLAQNADTVTLANQGGAPDPAATWGLKQLGPGTVIVAAGTAVLNPSPGVYTYDYGTLGLDPTLRYAISFKAVKAGETDQYGVAIIEGVRSSASLRNLRRRLAAYLGDRDRALVGVSGGALLGNYYGSSTDRRKLCSSDLAAADRAGTAPALAADTYNGGWCYVPSSQLQRPVAAGGMASNQTASAVLDGSLGGLGAEKVAELTFERPLDAALAGGTEFELYRVLPPMDAPRFVGLHACINRALEALPMRDRLAQATDGSYRYSLAEQTWLTDERRVSGVFGPEITSGVTGLPLDFDARLDAETPYLETGLAYDVPDSIYLDVQRPRSSWIRIGGVWGESTSGLVNETDEATGDPQIITLLAAYFALDFMANEDPRGIVPGVAARRDRLVRILGPSLLWSAAGARVERPPLQRAVLSRGAFR